MLRLALCTLVAMAMPVSAWAALGDPFDITDPTPRDIIIGVDLLPPTVGQTGGLLPPDPTDPLAPCPTAPSGNSAQNVPAASGDRYCRYVHLIGVDQGSHAKPFLATGLTVPELGAAGMMRGTWTSDGVTGTFVIGSVQAQGFIGGTPGSADPQGDCSLITTVNPGGTSTLCPIPGLVPWTDFIVTFDIATGHATTFLQGTVDSGVGALAFAHNFSTMDPADPTAIAAFPGGYVGGWPTEHPYLAGFTLGGVKIGVDYGAIFDTPIDFVCTTGNIPSGTVVSPGDAEFVATLSGGNSDGTCEAIGGRPYAITANLPTDMIPSPTGFVGTVNIVGPSLSLTTDNSILGTNTPTFGDLALFEIPEPSSYLLLGLGVLGLAGLRRRA